MRAVEFIAELGPDPTLTIPQEAADLLPKTGKARIIILTADDDEDGDWRLAAYEQFMRDDAPEDAIYDNLP